MACLVKKRCTCLVKYGNDEPFETIQHVCLALRGKESLLNLLSGILGRNGNYAAYSAEGGARIGQMMAVFCNSENIEIETVAFLHDGFRVFPFHTVDQWEMEDLDIVDVIPHPMGCGPGKAAARI